MTKARELADLIANVNNGSSLANKNFIINGAMTVAQRATSATASGNGTYNTIDRWMTFDGNDGRGADRCTDWDCSWDTPTH